jgi:hypothetical protein
MFLFSYSNSTKMEHSGTERTVVNGRLLIMSVLAAVAAGSYGVLRHYSPSLVGYVVEQTLLQKAPDGSNPLEVRRSYQAWLGGFGDGNVRLERLFAMSQQLEKVQKLSDLEMNQLLKKETGSPPVR